MFLKELNFIIDKIAFLKILLRAIIIYYIMCMYKKNSDIHLYNIQDFLEKIEYDLDTVEKEYNMLIGILKKEREKNKLTQEEYLTLLDKLSTIYQQQVNEIISQQ